MDTDWAISTGPVKVLFRPNFTFVNPLTTLNAVFLIILIIYFSSSFLVYFLNNPCTPSFCVSCTQFSHSDSTCAILFCFCFRFCFFAIGVTYSHIYDFQVNTSRTDTIYLFYKCNFNLTIALRFKHLQMSLTNIVCWLPDQSCSDYSHQQRELWATQIILSHAATLFIPQKPKVWNVELNCRSCPYASREGSHQTLILDDKITF